MKKYKVSVLMAGVFLSVCGCTYKPQEAVTAFDWSSKVIQVEQRSPDGQWHAREPLSLARQVSVIGNAVGKPDFVVSFDVSTNQEENGLISVTRKIVGRCADGSHEVSMVFNQTSVQADWMRTLDCGDSAWRMTLVDSSIALRPPVAAAGELLL